MKQLGVLMLAALLAIVSGGCGGEGDDGDGGEGPPRTEVTPTPTSALAVGLMTAPDGLPLYQLSGDNGRIIYRAAPDGVILQALHIGAVFATEDPIAVRVFYDEATGLPRVAHDTATGAWMAIRANGPSRVDFWSYGRNGTYQGGFAIYEEGGRYYMGRIVGAPVLQGRRITGPLNPEPAVWTGSFTLEGDIADGLTNIQAVPAEHARFIESVIPSAGASANTASPVVAQAGLSVQEGLIYVGLGLVAIGAAPALVAGGAVVTSAVVIGGSMALIGVFAGDVQEAIRGQLRRTPGCASYNQGICDIASNYLAKEDARGALGFMCDLYEQATQGAANLAGKISNGRRARDNARGLTSEERADVMESVNTYPGFYRGREPASLEAPPVVSSNVSGEARGLGGRTTAVHGVAAPDGSLDVSGQDNLGRQVQISLQVDDGVNEGGDFSWGEHEGTVPAAPGPRIVRELGPQYALPPDNTWSLLLSNYFAAPEGRPITYDIDSSHPTVRARISGQFLVLETGSLSPGDSSAWSHMNINAAAQGRTVHQYFLVVVDPALRQPPEPPGPDEPSETTPLPPAIAMQTPEPGGNYCIAPIRTGRDDAELVAWPPDSGDQNRNRNFTYTYLSHDGRRVTDTARIVCTACCSDGMAVVLDSNGYRRYPCADWPRVYEERSEEYDYEILGSRNYYQQSQLESDIDRLLCAEDL